MHAYSYRYLLAFGSNLGNRAENFKKALLLLEPFLHVKYQTTWRSTTPLIHSKYDTSDHDYYLNFVCDGVSDLDPFIFYRDVIVKIEDQIGHCRVKKWQPRNLDIDILFAAKNNSPNFNKCYPLVIEQNDFVVPHLCYFEREFWRQMVEKELFVSLDTIKRHFLDRDDGIKYDVKKRQ